MLVDAKASVTVTDKLTKATPLHLASFYGKIEVVKLLLKSGAQVDAGRLFFFFDIFDIDIFFPLLIELSSVTLTFICFVD